MTLSFPPQCEDPGARGPRRVSAAVAAGFPQGLGRIPVSRHVPPPGDGTDGAFYFYVQKDKNKVYFYGHLNNTQHFYAILICQKIVRALSQLKIKTACIYKHMHIHYAVYMFRYT